MTKALGIALGLLALAPSATPAVTAGAATGVCATRASGGFPSFCNIPRTPADVRGAKAFKAAVVDARRAGRRVMRETAPATFGLPLGEAEAFSRAAQAEAAPPPEMAGAPPEQSEAAAAELRRLAAPPPPRSH